MPIMNPIPSDTLADSIGVNIHLEQLGTSFGPSPYAQFDTVVKPLMQKLGVRYYRNGIDVGSTVPASIAAYDGKHIALAAMGLKGIFVVGTQGKVYDYTTISSRIMALGGAVGWLSGWNEPSASVAGAPAMLAAITSLNNAKGGAKSVSPGFTGGAFYPAWVSNNVKPFPIADIDFGDWHTYQHSAHPENTNVVPLSGYLAGMRNTYAVGKPFFVTETGYTSNLNITSGTIVRGCPENIIARYIPRLFVFYLQSGVTRTWWHQLLDGEPATSGRQNNAYGLADYNGVPKARFNALKNLISLFSDVGPSFVPKSVDMTVQSSIPINTALFQKRDGENLLCIWRGESGWSNEAGQKLPIDVPSTTVTLSLPSISANIVVFNDDGTLTGADGTPTGGEVAAIPLKNLMIATDLDFSGNTQSLSFQGTFSVSVSDRMTVVRF